MNKLYLIVPTKNFFSFFITFIKNLDNLKYKKFNLIDINFKKKNNSIKYIKKKNSLNIKYLNLNNNLNFINFNLLNKKTENIISNFKKNNNNIILVNGIPLNFDKYNLNISSLFINLELIKRNNFNIIIELYIIHNNYFLKFKKIIKDLFFIFNKYIFISIKNIIIINFSKNCILKNNKYTSFFKKYNLNVLSVINVNYFKINISYFNFINITKSMILNKIKNNFMIEKILFFSENIFIYKNNIYKKNYLLVELISNINDINLFFNKLEYNKCTLLIINDFFSLKHNLKLNNIIKFLLNKKFLFSILISNYDLSYIINLLKIYKIDKLDIDSIS
ncbi:hypothetical protein NAREPO1_01970 [endosymbiont of Euscepes postfasciatus]|uniref:hypothetical protein n=1 Tax=endosymbiont of Euscepes postfasciatus TaxID=650377 RepID=UPI000DC6FCCE|nr:hypothetical protein [endosymbiont of Euscepes postfasciatus]BBA84709.1 hypothetical protein NAREPO1_01970 [endosymbiont of Euscepes postfasciatus]